MGFNSKIEWCHHTINPWIGCSKVSEECRHCYAEALAKRYGWARWGAGQERVKTSDAIWRKPLMWNKQAAGPEVPQFQLCYSIAKCCFSGPPQVQHFVDSTVVNGGSVPYYSGLVSVTGTLHVNVKVDQEVGKVVSVYQLDVERVEPK